MSLNLPIPSLFSSEPTYLSEPGQLVTSQVEGEVPESRWSGPNTLNLSSPPPPPSSSANERLLPSVPSTPTTPTTSQTPPPTVILDEVPGLKLKTLPSPPLFLQEFPPILDPSDSPAVRFDFLLPLLLEQDPNLPQLAYGEPEGGIVEERIMGLLRAVYEDAVGEGGGKGSLSRRWRVSGTVEVGLEEGNMALERSRSSSTRSEDEALPDTPLGGEEMSVLGRKKTVESDLGWWVGGGEEAVGEERVEFGKRLDVLEGRGSSSVDCSTEKGDPFDVVFEEDEIELRRMEDGVGSLWV